MSEVTRKVYEITEDLRRDLLSRKIKEIRPEELDSLAEELIDYYRKNCKAIVQEVKRKSVKIQFLEGGGGSLIQSSFVKKFAFTPTS